jgi:6-pyruvoyltetrahydropterin/6-carboxytetrahydropterin synthase
MSDRQDTLIVYTAAASIEAARELDGHIHGHSFTLHARTATPPAVFHGAAASALRTSLEAAVEPVDFTLLNETISEPSDVAIAHWMKDRLAALDPGIVSVCSSRHSGAVLDSAGRALNWRRYRVEAAHQLPHVPPGHKCGRMHGHGFDIVLHTGLGEDIDKAWQPLQSQLHHACLNDIEGLENPTSEVLARWIWQRLQSELESLAWVSVFETYSTGCHFDGKSFQIWKEQNFESAIQLSKAPGDDRRRRLHGHSYLVRMHLKGPIDDVMGWAMDYGDVKTIFAPLHWQLDHHDLGDLAGIDGDNSLEALVHWIRDQLSRDIDILNRIDLYETPGCGAILYDPGDFGQLVLGTDERL